MRNRYRAAIVLTGLAFLMAMGSGQFSRAATAEPTSSAIQWLQMMDAAKFPAAYADAGAIYHARITYAAFEAKAKLFHDAVGPLVHRNVDNVAQTGTLKDMPPGQYAEVRFTSEFNNKKNSVETVYLAFEGGLWRVAGYDIN